MKWIIFILTGLLVISNVSAEKLCFLGDMGTGGKKQLKVAAELERQKCDAIMVLGDIVYPFGIKSVNDAQLMTKFLSPYRDVLKTTTFFLTLGNHDYYGNQKAWLGVHLMFKRIIFPDFWYKFKIDGICFYALDTNNYKYTMWKWLKEQLEKDKDCRKKIAFGHHPYRSSGTHGRAGFIKGMLMKWAMIGDVDLYIAGHDHQLSDEGSYNGTVQLISGAGGKLRDLAKRPGVWGASKLGFIIIDSKTLKFQFVDVKGNVLHGGEF